MPLAFRNVDASPDDPVDTWPTEAVRSALERGGLTAWQRLAREIADDPWGPVARRVEAALAGEEPYGAGPLMRDVIAAARTRAERGERETVAAEVRQLIVTSSLTQQSFASRIGTSPSRLSTYVSGAVTPSAALIVRMQRVTARGHGATDTS